MNPFLILTLIGLITASIGAVGYLNSTKVEVYKKQNFSYVRDLEGRTIEESYGEIFNAGYKIVKKDVFK